MNKKIFLSLVLLSAVVFAQQGTQSIQTAMCDLQEMTQTMVAAITVFSIILALPIIAAGIIFYVKKKPKKNLGIALIIAGVVLPVVFILIYLLIPIIMSALLGGGPSMECY